MVYHPLVITIRTFENLDELVLAAETVLRTALPLSGTAMLSGGSTPYAVYDRLARNPCPVHPERRLFLSDERMVPLDSTASNTGNLRSMLDALDCHDHFIGIDTSLDIETATRQFGAALDQIDSIDIGFLGMGTDGHTAGLFTAEQTRQTTGLSTLHALRPDGLPGISVTPVVFHKTDQIILLVTGEQKREVIKTLLTAPQSIPAGSALQAHPHAELWTDIRL